MLAACIDGTTSSASCTQNSENSVTSKVVQPINVKFHQNQPTAEEGIHMNFRRRLAQLYTSMIRSTRISGGASWEIERDQAPSRCRRQPGATWSAPKEDDLAPPLVVVLGTAASLSIHGRLHNYGEGFYDNPSEKVNDNDDLGRSLWC
jgi:hypothetical protein